MSNLLKRMSGLVLYARPTSVDSSLLHPHQLKTFSRSPLLHNSSKKKSDNDNPSSNNQYIGCYQKNLYISTKTEFSTKAASGSVNKKTSKDKKSLKCWKCSSALNLSGKYGLLLCEKCSTPQKLRGDDIPDYYELLGAKRTYRVDLDELGRRSKGLQRKLHPDLYAQRGSEEQELSQELSSLINKAFGILSDPIERGRYLLELHGVHDPIGEAEKEMTSDPEFLEEVMELNERLEELNTEKDWMDFRKHNDNTLHSLQSELSDAFNAEKISEAKLILGRMKYFDTLQGKLRELKSKLGIVE